MFVVWCMDERRRRRTAQAFPVACLLPMPLDFQAPRRESFRGNRSVPSLLRTTRYLILVPIVGLGLAAAIFFVAGGISLIGFALDVGLTYIGLRQSDIPHDPGILMFRGSRARSRLPGGVRALHPCNRALSVVHPGN